MGNSDQTLEIAPDADGETTEDFTPSEEVSCTHHDERKPLPWLVMRDLKRHNAKNPAYVMLAKKGFEVYTPMKCNLVRKSGHVEKIVTPAMPDMVFVHCTESKIKPVVELTPTLQFRYVRGGYLKVMKVEHSDMHRFMEAVRMGNKVDYYTPEEITPDMIGKKVLLKDGPFEGLEVRLLKKHATKKKCIIVELPSVFAAVVEVNPEYIQLIK